MIVIIVKGDRMNKNIRIITVSTFALLGILCITTGIYYAKNEKKDVNKTVFVVVQKRQLAKQEEATIKLKNIEIEVNTPLSVKIVDFLDSKVSNEVLANLTLDTSTVNVTQPGTYQYSITYQTKVYTGTIVVKEKQTPTSEFQNITLKALNVKLGTILTNEISNYIIENVSDETKALMKLDISQVNTNIAATYQYNITYNNSVYTSTITVTEDQPTLSTATTTTEDAEIATPSTPKQEEPTKKKKSNREN